MLHLCRHRHERCRSTFVAPWAPQQNDGAVVKVPEAIDPVVEIAIAIDQAEHTWPEFAQRLRKILDLPTLARLVLCVSL